jgi:DNA-binding MarR family transcriptional regulator
MALPNPPGDLPQEDFGAATSALLFLEKYPWIDSESLQTHIALSRAFLALNRALTRSLLPQGIELSRAQYNFLSVLSLAEDNQLSLREIARETGVSPAYVTKLLDDLAQQGLVERVSSPADRRVTHAHLTPQGQERCQTIVPGYLQFIDTIGNNLSLEEKQQLRHLLAKYAVVDEA